MSDNKIRCTHKDRINNERYNCICYNCGLCEGLKEPAKDREGHCIFYKPSQTFIAELKEIAYRLDLEFTEYLIKFNLQWVIAYLEK